MIILKIMLNKNGGNSWTGLVWLRIGGGGESCELGNEKSGSIKCEEFLD